MFRLPSVTFRFVALAVPSGLLLTTLGLLVVAVFAPQKTLQAAATTVSVLEPEDVVAKNDPKRVMGISKSDCKKCHASEVAAWTKTVHYQTANERLQKFEGNTKKYADALKIPRADLLTDSACASCHGTQTSTPEKGTHVIAGVSCESCHGGAGGEDGWLNAHQSYHSSQTITRAEETEEHRTARLAKCDKAGMVRSGDIYSLAKACYGCHMVGNEALVASGHKLASSFEFVSWSTGEVRHNFFIDKTKNADAPTLLAERTGGKIDGRRRMKFVVGAMVQLEMALRLRATAKNPAVIPQLGGLAAAANGKLAQINGMAATDELQSVTTLAAPMLGTLFVPMPTDEKTYTEAAEKVAAQTKEFVKNHDGTKFKALDALIKTTPPHFSQQYKDKYGK